MANSEIEMNNIDDSVEILSAGLKIYPDNPVAHLLLGKAYALMGTYDKALEYFKKGSELIHSDDTYDYYLDQIDSIRKQRSMFEATRGKSFFNSSEVSSDLKNEPDLFNTSDKNVKEEELVVSIDERLSQIADQISKAKISISHNASVTNTGFENIIYEDNLIISETLAKIYIAQNEYGEAIKVYKKLVEKKPELEEHYTDMINEIKSKINS